FIPLVPFQFHRHALLFDKDGIADGTGTFAGFGPGADQDGGWHDNGNQVALNAPGVSSLRCRAADIIRQRKPHGFRPREHQYAAYSTKLGFARVGMHLANLYDDLITASLDSPMFQKVPARAL